mmetsp:Transcript_10529/g.31441  ORF Transcript_10529/g.31441 Transcript_10529/m.31441 type:complete len:316 (-) Transcript_10529:254-1201(-)
MGVRVVVDRDGAPSAAEREGHGLRMTMVREVGARKRDKAVQRHFDALYARRHFLVPELKVAPEAVAPVGREVEERVDAALTRAAVRARRTFVEVRVDLQQAPVARHVDAVPVALAVVPQRAKARVRGVPKPGQCLKRPEKHRRPHEGKVRLCVRPEDAGVGVRRHVALVELPVSVFKARVPLVRRLRDLVEQRPHDPVRKKAVDDRMRERLGCGVGPARCVDCGPQPPARGELCELPLGLGDGLAGVRLRLGGPGTAALGRVLSYTDSARPSVTSSAAGGAGAPRRSIEPCRVRRGPIRGPGRKPLKLALDATDG